MKQIKILLSDYFLDNYSDKRYITNIIGGAFLFISLCTVLFIKEDLKRFQKDAEVQQDKVENISINKTNSKFRENEEYLLNANKKFSNKSNFSERSLGI